MTRSATIARVRYLAIATLMAVAPDAGCDLVTAWGGGVGLRCTSDEACAPGQSCIDQVCRRVDSGPGTDAAFDRDGGDQHDTDRDAARTDRAGSDRYAADRSSRDATRSDRTVEQDRPPTDATLSDQNPRHDTGAYDRQTADASVGDRVTVDAALYDRCDAGQPDLLVVDATDAAAAADAGTTCEQTNPYPVLAPDCNSHGYVEPVWNLIEHDLTLEFVYDATGIIDEPADARTWGRIGVRTVGDVNDSPSSGIWLLASIEWVVNTLDPDPPGVPDLDLDDHLMLQQPGSNGEGSYDLPGTPPVPGNNHRFWFDRDGVTAIEAQQPHMVDGGNYNTGGIYHIVISLHATDPTHGTAFMKVNGLDQGFEVDGDWFTIEMTPAGMTWTGDLTRMQVFFGMDCRNVDSTIEFNDIMVTGCLAG